MKEKIFKVREIDGVVVKNMSDKQAGELYKAICAYNFNNEEYNGKDPLVKSVFELMKNSFNYDKFCRETGKIGGVKSQMVRRDNDNLGPCVARAIIGGDMVNEMFKSIFGDGENPAEMNKVPDSKIPEKKAK